ncbi:MAG: hypothetical protein H6Q05_3148, partial [Acidobacteria bacterium]|nr:hypothetical protein [Acidobacteriota bacterium]
GTVAGPDVRPDRAVQAASAFPGWHPGCPCRQGSRPGLSCATLSGSSAFSIRVSPWQASETPWQAGETYDKRHRSWVAAGCRPAAPHQGFTAQPMAATRRSDDSWKRHNRNLNRYRYRDRHRHHRAAGINTEASDYAQFSIAIATAIAIPIPTPTVIPWC